MLSNTKVKRLKPKEKLYRIADHGGLAIEVRPNGAKNWVYRFRINGKATMKKVGSFPELTVEVARELRDSLKSDVVTNVITQVKSKKTFESVAQKWFETRTFSKKNEVTMRGRLVNYIYPAIGDMDINHIKPAHILNIIKPIEESGKLDTAKRVRIMISQIFQYAIANLVCESDPASVLRGATKAPKPKHHRAITDVETFSRMVFDIFNKKTRLDPVTIDALKLGALIPVRNAELRGIKKSDIDFNKKIISIERTKMGRSLIIPVSDFVLDICRHSLEYSSGTYLLEHPKSKTKQISESRFNDALKSLGYHDRHVFHGFRSSFSTIAREELRLDGELIEMQLDHIDSSSVRRAYDRSLKIEERRVLMQRWSDFIESASK